MLNQKTSKNIIEEEINNPIKKIKLENTIIRFLLIDLSQIKNYESIYLYKADKKISIKKEFQNLKKIDNIPYYDFTIFENDVNKFIDNNIYYYNEKFCISLNNNKNDEIYGILPIYLNKINNIYLSLGNNINTLSFEILFYSPYIKLPSEINIYNQDKEIFNLKIYDYYGTKYRNRILFLNINNKYIIKCNNIKLLDLNIFVPQDYKLIKSLNDNNNLINDDYFKIISILINEFLLKSNKYNDFINNILLNKSLVDINKLNPNSDILIKLLNKFIPQGYDIIIRIDKKHDYHINAHQIKYKKDKKEIYSNFYIKDINTLIEKLKQLNEKIILIYNNASKNFKLSNFLRQISEQRKILINLTQNYKNYFNYPLNYSKKEFEIKEYSLFNEYYKASSIFLFDDINNVFNENEEKENDDNNIENCFNILSCLIIILEKINNDIYKYILNFSELNIFEKILFLISSFNLLYDNLNEEKTGNIMNFGFKIFNFSDNNKENPYIFAKNFVFEIIKNLSEESRLFYIFLQINSKASNILYSNKTYNNNNESISNYLISMLSLEQVKNHILKIFPKYIIRYYRNKKERAILHLKTNLVGINEKHLFKQNLEKNEKNFLNKNCKNYYSMPIISELFHEVTGHSKYKESQKEKEIYPNYFQDDILDFQIKSIDKIEMNEKKKNVENGFLVEYFISDKYSHIKFLKDVKNNFSEYYNINLWIKENFNELNSKIERDIKTYKREYKEILKKDDLAEKDELNNNDASNISCILDFNDYEFEEEDD